MKTAETGDGTVPLSEAALWGEHRAYYERSGVRAWSTNAVPHRVTTNPRIARVYAELVLAWASGAAAPGGAPPSRVHVLELGCATGRFAHQFLRAWDDLRASAAGEGPELRYLATDVVADNVAFLLAHPAARDDVAAGRLSGLALDPLATVSGAGGGAAPAGLREFLEPRPGEGAPAPPVVVIANYALDSLPVDAFVVRGGTLWEARVDGGSATIAGDVARVRWRLAPCRPSGRFPGEPGLAEVLASLADGPDRVVTFPSGALRVLDGLARLAARPTLWVVSDKGTVRDDTLPPDAPPGIEVHGGGCVSTLLEFGLVGRWVRRSGGEMLLPSHSLAVLYTCAWVVGGPAPRPLRETFQRRVEASGPDDDFCIIHRLVGSGRAYRLPEALSVLRWGGGDPYLWADCFPSLMAALPDVGMLRSEALDVVGQVARQWYDIGEPTDVGFQLASAFLELGELERAAALLEASTSVRGEQAATLFQLARVAHRRGAPGEALERLRAARALDDAVESTLQHLGILAGPIARDLEATLCWELGQADAPLGDGGATTGA